MNETILIELRTEELPPKSLKLLSEAFADAVFSALRAQEFTTAASVCTPYATPRRLALTISEVAGRQPDRLLEKKGPAVAGAIDAAGQPTRALEGFMRAAGVGFAQLHRTSDAKGEYFVARREQKGEDLSAHLAAIVAQAVRRLPIPKVMRWGDSEHQFVRPAHSLILLHGGQIVAGEVLGLASGRTTMGHRFLSAGEVVIERADDYAARLATAKVIASFGERRALIASQLEAAASSLAARINPATALLDEVTALVEWPVVYVGEFEAEFLEVPQECLILTMQQNQKYFPLLDAAGRLLNRFLIVANMQVDDPAHIIRGNERVVRPRLSDARFFFNQDRKAGFANRVIRLGDVVYHNRLGSLGDRAQRLGRVARAIAERLGADGSLAERAALFAKIDLLTDMVGEFPELQGIMGRYYLLHEGGLPVVADAIEQHYRPRFAGDSLPQGNIACAAALADKLDALVGFFGIGQLPTGDKDPFGLRRAALGVLRILMETPLPLDLGELIADARDALLLQGVRLTAVDENLLAFLLDRLRGMLREAGHPVDAIEAVLAQRPTRIDLVPARLAAVREFQAMPEAQALAAANKRIGNILKKADEALPEPDIALLEEEAEKALFQRVVLMAPLVRSHVANEDYADALKVLAAVRGEVDRFFDEVMVNVDEPLLRGNRLGLLRALYEELNAVADISKLAV
ncbi:glycine--tRNA ligase subunit beta [Accumulibacter sp.]|uniref:glycine--tRNA ligase subunit beta n=1 Tax=Accumulibacter sp. TaxID=2053492 RepID=UPI0025CC3B8B|nr:glycine--tRNA ligase subunit beta [Accumulibacter sp.]MCM8613877.1 glycine--tRNA ligase subunit beta [Accumulibacter sp.]MCM8638090.1 glycine--tRNA ligase subunit beta [Accumulibacter sp.]MCM8641370.1 glycine--tRNA ligase subunit beta [Accumulibacter sp.]